MKKSSLISLFFLPLALLFNPQGDQKPLLDFFETIHIDSETAVLPLGPFGCGGFYVTYGQGAGNFGSYNSTGGIDNVGIVGAGANATGYNTLDGYLYTIRGSDEHLLRLHSDGTVDDLGATGLTGGFVTGGFDESGNFYVKEGNTNPIYIIDVTGPSFTTVTPANLFFAKDWAYHVGQGKFYGVHATDLYSFDPVSVTVSQVPITGIIAGEGTVFGAAFYSGDGYIYVASNATGNIYRIDVVANEAHFVLAATPIQGSDGASCVAALPPFSVVYAHSDTVCVPQTGSATYDILQNDDVHMTTLDLPSFSVLTPPSNGTWTYNPGTGELTYTSIGAPQLDQLVYQICGTGSPTVCDYATVYFQPAPVVTFNPIGPYCQNETPASLPTTSNEGVSGTWNPSTVSTSTPGTTTYTFTPNPTVECGFPVEIEITVNPTEFPTFNTFGPYCQNDVPDPLPTTSNEGISGTWSPAVINTITPGTSNYTFTPDANLHPCAVPETISVTVNPTETATFPNIGPYCQDDPADPLPLVSNEGISGTWNPTMINTATPGTNNYTFTPNPNLHPCGEPVTIAVTINPTETPTFPSFGPYCQNEVPEPLPPISQEGIAGTWSPSTISTATPGTTPYLFSPDPVLHPCGDPTFITVVVVAAETPTFPAFGPYCQNATPDPLPSASNEGISGTWDPATINTANTGTSNYTFTPDPASFPCADIVVVTITVAPEETPTFGNFGPYCQNAPPDPLLPISNEGIVGSWSPSTIETGTPGTNNYTFIPNPTLHPCADTLVISVTVIVSEIPTFPSFGPYCQNETPAPLPPVSNEGILGTWTPATINTNTPGTSNYTFSPDSDLHPCADTVVIQVVVGVEDTATFSVFGPYCQNATPDTLPSSSNEGIMGVWSPSAINTSTPGTSTYTFTPDPALYPCVDTVLIDITILADEVPTFNAFGPYCLGESPDTLPALSNEGIVGTWVPGQINADTSGTNSYTFVPDPALHPCADPAVIDVTIFSAILVEEIDFQCAPDLQTYDLEIFISGGSDTYTSVNAGGYTVVDNGGGSFTIQAIPSGSGTTIDVTDDAGCTLTFSTTPQDCDCLTVPLPSGAQGNVYCFGEDPTSISVDDPGAGYQVNWYDVANNFLSNDNPYTPTGPGDYFATIEEILSACESDSVQVSLVEIPEVVIQIDSLVCAVDLQTYDLYFTIGGGSGVIDTVEAGGLIVMEIGGGQYTVEEIPSGSGVTITVSDDAGCVAILDNSPHDCDCATIPPPTGAQDNVYCFGEVPTAISVDDPGAGYQVNWYDASDNFLSNDNPYTPNAAGDYFATVEELATGCESVSVLVILTELAPVEILEGDFNCAADLLTYDLDISVSGGTGLFPTIDAGGLNAVDNGGGSYTIEGVASGTGITVTVTDDAGCSATVNTAEQTCDCPTIDPPTGAMNGSFCFGETPTSIFVDDPGAGFQINWYDDANNFLSNDNPFTPPSTGTYFATIEEIVNGCESSPVEVVLTESPEIFIAEGDFDCAADLLTYDLEITVEGGTGLFPTIDAGGLNAVDNGGGSYTIEGIASGMGITVTVTDDAGCSAIVNTAEQTCDCPTIDPPTGAMNSSFCFGETPTSISVNDPGTGFQINWYDDANNFLSNDNPYTPPSAGTYFATIEEIINGCESSPVEVVLTESPEILIAEGDFDCAADLLTYDLEITVEGGTGLFSTIDAGGLNVVDNGGGSFTIEGIVSGTGIAVSVTDDAGCSTTLNTIPQICDCPPVAEPANPVNGIMCFGGVPVSISVDDPGMGFQINWYEVPTGGNPVSTGSGYLPPGPGTYYAEVLNLTTNCTSDRVEVILSEASEILATTDTEICPENVNNYDLTVEIVGGTGPYQLDAGGPNVVENNPFNFTIEQVSGAAGLTLTITDDMGCMQAISVQPFILPSPTANAGADQILTCQSTTVTLSGSGSDIGQYEWTGPTPFSSSLQAPTTDIPGTYTLLVTDANGCTDIDETEVSEDIDSPLAEAGPDQQLDCVPGEVTLSASTDVTNPVLNWSPGTGIVSGGNTLEPVVNAAGTYLLTVTNPQNGCSASDSLTVLPPESFSFSFETTSIGCEGEQNGSVFITAVDGGLAPYLYSLNGGSTFETSNLFSNLMEGNYNLVVQDANGCEETEVALVEGAFPISLLLEDQVQINLGENYQINVQTNLLSQQIGNVQWTPAAGLSCSDCLNPIASPEVSTTYQLSLTDTLGCPASASIAILVVAQTKIYMPNIFSPNNDGINDIFFLNAGKGVGKVNRMQIFDRWGALIFEAIDIQPNDIQKGWDGTYRGKAMNPGVYAYYAEVEMEDGRTEIVKGHVTLVK